MLNDVPTESGTLINCAIMQKDLFPIRYHLLERLKENSGKDSSCWYPIYKRCRCSNRMGLCAAFIALVLLVQRQIPIVQEVVNPTKIPDFWKRA